MLIGLGIIISLIIIDRLIGLYTYDNKDEISEAIKQELKIIK